MEKIMLNNEEETKFINNIDFKPLFDKINEIVGIKLTYHIEVAEAYNKEKYIKFTIEENLSNFYPILDTVWREFKVVGNGHIYKRKNEKIIFSMEIDYNYSMYEGGWNGNALFTCWYDEEKQWTFSIPREKEIEKIEKIIEYFKKHKEIAIAEIYISRKNFLKVKLDFGNVGFVDYNTQHIYFGVDEFVNEVVFKDKEFLLEAYEEYL